MHLKGLRETTRDEISVTVSPTPILENATSYSEFHSKLKPYLLGNSFRGYRVALLVLVGLACVWLSTEGCSGAGMGYRAAYKAARSELSATTLARDNRLKLQLREAIFLDQTYLSLAISPYVYMERGFVVGSVESIEQAEGILRAARIVQGLRSLYGHLPVRNEVTEENEETGGSLSDLTITTEVKANLVLVPGIWASQIEIQVLGGDVVLLGVVASEEVRGAAEREARLVSGVNGVTNLLLLPESGYMKRRPRLLR